MYLSQLTLNPTHPAARRDLSSAYEMHRTLARAFVDDDSSTPARFLWRLERERNGLPATTLLVQAPQPGRWAALQSDVGYIDRLAPDKHVDLRRLLQAGRRYRFRLMANPTVTRDGKRFGLHGDEAQLAWLERQGQHSGFAIENAMVSARDRLSAARRRGEQRVTLDCVQFDGILRADDAEAIGAALGSGIGHGKAFGLGLLSLAPLARTAGNAVS